MGRAEEGGGGGKRIGRRELSGCCVWPLLYPMY